MKKLLSPGDMIRFFAHPHVCLVLGVRVERYEGEFTSEGGEDETIIKYLHPLSGVLERSLVYFNGRMYVGMKEVIAIE
jgi:hypothetical protein